MSLSGSKLVHRRGFSPLVPDIHHVPYPRGCQSCALPGSECLCVQQIEETVLRRTAPPDEVAAIFFQFCAPPLRTRVFANIKRALKPDGLLLMEGYTPKQLQYKTGGPSEIENLYTRELLEKSFADFSKLEIAEYDSEIHEGPGHGGMSALIDLVGRK